MSTEASSSKDEIRELSKSYLDSLDSEVDQSKKREMMEDLEESKELRDQLIADHGKEHLLVERATEVISELEAEFSEFEEAETKAETLRKDLLEAVADNFELSELWLDETVIQAVTSALYGREDDAFFIFDEQISNEADVSDISAIEKIKMENVVVLLANDCLEGHENVDEQWERVRSSKGYAAFKIVAERGPISSSDIADELGEKKSTVNNWLKNPINLWDQLIPYYRPEKGLYNLSTTGRYFTTKSEDLGPNDKAEGVLDQDEERAREESDEEDTEESASQQAELLTESAKDESPEDDEPTSMDVEDTDEKAEAMFSNVGTVDEDE